MYIYIYILIPSSHSPAHKSDLLTFSKTSAIEVSQRHATSSCTFKQVHASHWHKLWYSKVFARIKCLVWSPQVFANDWQHWHKLWHSKVFARVKRLVWSPHVFANDWQHWHKVWHSKVFARIKCMVWSPQVFANDWQHGPHPPKGVGGRAQMFLEDNTCEWGISMALEQETQADY